MRDVLNVKTNSPLGIVGNQDALTSNKCHALDVSFSCALDGLAVVSLSCKMKQGYERSQYLLHFRFTKIET
jgi:hypothetical protein